MKKSRLLLATPLMLAPVLAVVPAITSCNKHSDISLSGDFAKNVNVEAVSEKLVIGEPYIIKLSIKPEQKGKEFLPNTLTKVTSGGQELELEPDPETANGSYYTYDLYENNTVAYLTVLSANGAVGIEAETATVKTVTATGVDIQWGTVAEFEIGETLGDEATRSRILVVVTLSNSDRFVLSDTYSITLEGYKTGDTFTKEETDNKGTVTYCGVTSNKFDYRVVTAKQAYLRYPDNTVEKCDTITTAISKYHNGATGNYIITIPYREAAYEFGTGIAVPQSANKHLTIRSNGATIGINGGQYGSGTHLFQVNENTSGSNSSVTFFGLNFKTPITKSPKFNQITLGDGSPHDITIANCSFAGDQTLQVKVNAVGTNTATTPYGVYMIDCEGYYLNSLFDGVVSHNDGVLLDFCIESCGNYFAQQLCNIASTNEKTRVLIDSILGSVMYTADESATALKGGMTISGLGSYWITDCLLLQKADLASGKHGAFIEVTTDQTYTGTRQLVLNNLYFVKADPENDNMHTVLNSYAVANEDWNIKYTDDESVVTVATVKSGPSITPDSYFDIDEE